MPGPSRILNFSRVLVGQPPRLRAAPSRALRILLNDRGAGRGALAQALGPMPLS